MPSWNRTRKQKKRNSKTQKGGKRLYSSVNDYTEEEIERIFCNGGLLTDLKRPLSTRPIFFIKWAPMASGKSSKKIMDIIERIVAPYPLESCADVSSDKLVENLLPFRYNTVDAKMKNIRMKADIELRDFAHAKRILQLQRTALAGTDKNLERTLTSLIDEPGGSSFIEENSEKDSIKKNVDFVFDTLLQKRVRQIYNTYYRKEKNQNSKTLRDKVIQFFPKAYARKVNIIYETAGLGYGESPAIGTLMARTRQGELRAKEASPIFKNTFANFLGEIVTAELLPGELKPVGYRPSSGEGAHPELFIPEEYRIIVIFPMVSVDDLVKRGYLRAYDQLQHTTLYDVNSDQKKEIAAYITALINTLTKGEKKSELPAKITEILTREFRERSQVAGEINYVKNLEDLRKASIENSVKVSSFPFFRLTAYDIETAVAQAFQYSVDYFLRQYIQIGRVEQVIYVNNN